MLLPPVKFPFRVRYVGTDPVHGARSITAGGHATACLIWLDPKHSHTWYPEDAEVTCTKCIERMGPPPFEYPIPGTVGTLQRRLAEVIENEVPPGYHELAGRRIAETVENWRRETEGRIRRTVDAAFAEQIPDTARTGVARLLVEKVLRDMEVGDGVTNEGAEK
jgi:hypothetical protein